MSTRVLDARLLLQTAHYSSDLYNDKQNAWYFNCLRKILLQKQTLLHYSSKIHITLIHAYKCTVTKHAGLAKHIRLVYSRCLVQVSTRTPANLTNFFCRFLHVRVVPQLGQDNCIPNHVQFIIHHSPHN